MRCSVPIFQVSLYYNYSASSNATAMRYLSSIIIINARAATSARGEGIMDANACTIVFSTDAHHTSGSGYATLIAWISESGGPHQGVDDLAYEIKSDQIGRVNVSADVWCFYRLYAWYDHVNANVRVNIHVDVLTESCFLS